MTIDANNEDSKGIQSLNCAHIIKEITTSHFENKSLNIDTHALRCPQPKFPTQSEKKKLCSIHPRLKRTYLSENFAGYES